MPKQHLYEYAVIRVVPQVEREEFVNVGIIVFCKKSSLVQCRIQPDETKLLCFSPKLDISATLKNLQAFEHIVSGDTRSLSAIAHLDAASRFRWLTATRSTIIQCSKIHPGLTDDLDETLQKLMEQLVL